MSKTNRSKTKRAALEKAQGWMTTTEAALLFAQHRLPKRGYEVRELAQRGVIKARVGINNRYEVERASVLAFIGVQQGAHAEAAD